MYRNSSTKNYAKNCSLPPLSLSKVGLRKHSISTAFHNTITFNNIATPKPLQDFKHGWPAEDTKSIIHMPKVCYKTHKVCACVCGVWWEISVGSWGRDNPSQHSSPRPLSCSTGSIWSVSSRPLLLTGSLHSAFFVCQLFIFPSFCLLLSSSSKSLVKGLK